MSRPDIEKLIDRINISKQRKNQAFFGKCEVQKLLNYISDLEEKLKYAEFPFIIKNRKEGENLCG